LRYVSFSPCQSLPIQADVLVLLQVLVAISCFGALNGSFYTTARLIRVLALEGSLPSTFGKLNATRNTPDHALGTNILAPLRSSPLYNQLI
jgi:amino acid transporter